VNVVCPGFIATDRDGDAAAALAGRLADADLRVRGAALDVTDAEAFGEIAARLESERGGIDLLFNNAGIGLAGELRDVSLEDWRRVMDVNVFGVVNGIHAVYPRMVARGRGQIVNTGSGAGLVPRPGMVPYAASKYAVVGLSTSLRGEAATLGVRVNVVCPGFIATDIQRRTVYRNLDQDELLASIPIKAMSAEQCAQVVLRGAMRDRAIIPVTGLTRAEWLIYRWAPWLSGIFTRKRADAFRAHRGNAAPLDTNAKANANVGG
ncbi:MAG: SDR family oxidoreductase, partial [Myxococcales bacterium]|nr:SDR family oxidoreductase [Myxococcales bacterium]